MNPASIKKEPLGLNEPELGPPMGPLDKRDLRIHRVLNGWLANANVYWPLC